ncbi:MAG: hypothetical protein GY702_27345 [Desulfobulbaceae bacterium]|nr:hypothetical protein [Desulfobulbaceae bacterium]
MKSKRSGRPHTDREIRERVRRMATANPRWEAPRIHGELLRLGLEVSERTVSNLMPRRQPNAKQSQARRTFLKNHTSKDPPAERVALSLPLKGDKNTFCIKDARVVTATNRILIDEVGGWFISGRPFL